LHERASMLRYTYEGVLISRYPDLLSHVVGRNRYYRWKEKSVHMPNCKSFLVTEAERKDVGQRARFQQHRDASCHQVFFFLQGKAPKEINAILKETLREHALWYVTVKKWVAWFKRVDFSTVMRLVLDDLKQ